MDEDWTWVEVDERVNVAISEDIDGLRSARRRDRR